MAKKSIDKVEEVINTPSVEVNADRASLILEACEKGGLTLEELVKTINEARGAIKSTSDKFGNIYEDPDHATRLKAVMLAAELRQDLKRGGGVNVAVAVVVSEKERELIEAYRQN
jgi:hypothetical protein